MNTPQEVSEFIICLEESDESVYQQIKLFAGALKGRIGGEDIQGLLTFRSTYWIPVDDKVIAYKALRLYLQNSGGQNPTYEAASYMVEVLPVSFTQLTQAVEAGNLSFSYFRKFGAKPDTSGVSKFIHESNYPMKTRKQVNPKFATLICFEGPDAEKAAKDYTSYTEGAVGVQRTIYDPDHYIKTAGYDAKVCCVEFHDCQKHPLKG